MSGRSDSPSKTWRKLPARKALTRSWRSIRSINWREISENASDALRNASLYASDIGNPTVRLGVTGLSRSGKTVFITSLVNNLLAPHRLLFFDAVKDGRLERSYLAPQPDDDVPRFAYEEHLGALRSAPPIWPQSTRQISQLRVTLDYEPSGALRRTLNRNSLNIDIVDYPGEWLLDLPLLQKSYAEWSAEAIAQARAKGTLGPARDWLGVLAELDPAARQDEQVALRAARSFTSYLEQRRSDPHAPMTVPPGRFLMPGDLEGAPLVTFAPLDVPLKGEAPPESLWSMMSRRFESYKTSVVKPFFENHFARLDRQIVLVDALTALNKGPEAIRDLERAMSDILTCFKPGANTWLTNVINRKIDRIVFAATKADHLHHSNHDRLEAILERIVRDAIGRAAFEGAQIRTMAMAAVRATREATAGPDKLPCIVGCPMPGETVAGQLYDGTREIAIFPGDLPVDPEQALAEGLSAPEPGAEEMRFIRFRPPHPDESGAPLPHIRLDRAIDFLFGDKLS